MSKNRQIEEEEFIDSKVVDYLTSVAEEEKSQRVVLMEIKNELFEATDYYKTQMETINNAQQLLDMLRNASDIEKNAYAATGMSIEKQQEKLDKYQDELEKTREKYIHVGLSEPSAYFTKIAYRRANYNRINKELSKVNSQRIIKDDNAMNKAIDTIIDCYGFKERDMEILIKFMSQVRLRTKMLIKDGKCDIRNYSQPKDFGIMPAFYGKQGCGKSAFARIIGDTISQGTCSEHGPDEIMGSFGTLDVFSKPVILLNEYGKQNKDGTDELKKYINGEVVTVNQKYKDPVTENCFASFILTSNFDPVALAGAEGASRRICVVNFTHNPTDTEENIRKAIETIWNSTDENTFEEFYHGTTAQDLAMENYSNQMDDTTEDWLSGLDDDTLLWLKTEKTNSISRIKNYLETEKHLKIFKNQLKSILSNENYFSKKTYGKHVYYQLHEDYYLDEE